MNTFSESVTKDTSILGSDRVVNLEVTFMVPLAPKKNVLKQIDHESTKKIIVFKEKNGGINIRQFCLLMEEPLDTCPEQGKL